MGERKREKERKRKRDEDSLLSVIFGDGQSTSLESSAKYQRSAMSSKHRNRKSRAGNGRRANPQRHRRGTDDLLPMTSLTMRMRMTTNNAISHWIESMDETD